MTRKTIIVGDVHGCYDELMDLLDKCQATSDDWIISLGDIVDRGPKVREVVDFFMQRDKPHERSMIQANHEKSQINYFNKWRSRGSPTELAQLDRAVSWRADYHRASFISLEPQHFKWFQSLPRFLYLPYVDEQGHAVVVVHAGCLPDVPLEEQDPMILLHVSDIKMPQIGGVDSHGRVQHGYWPNTTRSWWTSKAPSGARFWASLYDGSNGHVIFGHSGFLSPARFPYATGIDLGCCFGRNLCALILPDWRFVQIPARTTYKSTSGIRLFEVYPGIKVFS